MCFILLWKLISFLKWLITLSLKQATVNAKKSDKRQGGGGGGGGEGGNGGVAAIVEVNIIYGKKWLAER